MLDTAIHDIDAINYLVSSEVDNVYGTGGRLIHEKNEDHINAIMNYKNGVIATIESNWLMPLKERKLGIVTDKVFVSLDYMNQSIEVAKFGAEIENYNVKKSEPLKLEVKDFLTSIINKSSPLVTAASALKNLQLANLIQTSINQNKVKYKND
mgnify:CR=1 FL=1